MVLEHEILPYLQWLLYGEEGSLGALPRFFLIALAVALLGLLLGAVVSVARRGLLRGGDRIYGVIATGFREWFSISPRRIWALTLLATKEAWRRRIVVSLVLYLVILLFASWFLKTDNQEPAKLLLSFVLMATTYLVLGIALLLSAFSLPGDFKSKTIYTVVTKPVRAGEIILGRILGFSLIGTLLLVVMGCCSYIFVIRSLDHRHTVDRSNLVNVKDRDGSLIGYDGNTSTDASHFHALKLDDQHEGDSSQTSGHYHRVVRKGQGTEIQVQEPIGYQRARVPSWGKLRFKDRKGVDKAVGISVGSEWTYRSFIDGGTLAAAIWTFDGIDESLDDHLDEEGLPLGLITRVFRTHKGVIGQAISGAYQLRNPLTGLKSEPITFLAKDAQVDDRFVDRELVDSEGNTIDLYDDLVSEDGQLEIWIQCLERGQYFGYAQADCYLRLPDGSPLWNYVKSYISIWVQMVIVTSIGVAASALLSGPVAMLFTVSFIVLGFFREFFVWIADGPSYGGGPVESLVRLVTQKNVITKFDPGPTTTLIEVIDRVLQFFMQGLAQLLPDFSILSTIDFPAHGYNIPGDLVAQDLTVCLGYVIGLSVLGYFLLRTREIAR